MKRLQAVTIFCGTTRRARCLRCVGNHIPALTNTTKEPQMRSVRNIVLAAGAAGALALGSAVFAQDAGKPEAKPDTQAKKEHRGEHRQHGMSRMREMRGGCHGEAGNTPGNAPGGEHQH